MDNVYVYRWTMLLSSKWSTGWLIMTHLILTNGGRVNVGLIIVDSDQHGILLKRPVNVMSRVVNVSQSD